ncbi:hypothetical protein AYI70_g1519 [Smittium culicis]|uniref:SEC7 domain-containing protein n=1 Tax=Smittium culicis TaxID=133412 RepID=A0A1R1YC94_9FUNG|nr:hypothetical protein AYI70_g1519 [Smittium culicis]
MTLQSTISLPDSINNRPDIWPVSRDYWRDSIEAEIDRVVLEMRRNIKWFKLLEDEGLGALWVGGGLFPLYTPKNPVNSTFKNSSPLVNSSSEKSPDSSLNDAQQLETSPENSTEIFEDEQTKELYLFGKIGVKLGLTVFTLGEEYISENKEKNASEIQILRSFLDLKASLKSMFENDTLPVRDILFPFLQIVKSGIATGPIVRSSLESIHRLIKANLIDFSSEGGKEAITETSYAVTHCKFEATDSVLDETVLLQILEVLRLIMSSKHSYMLSDTAVCEMLEAVLSMACQMRINDILRRASELTLLELVGLVFQKTNSYSSIEKKPSGDSIQNTYYGIASVHELLRVLVMLTNPQNLQYTDTMRHLSIKALQVAIQTSSFNLSNFDGLKALVLNDLCHNLLLITSGSNPSLIIAATRLLIQIFQTQGQACKTQLELFLCQIVGRLMTPVSDSSNLNIIGLNGNVELKSSTTKLRRPSFVEENSNKIAASSTENTKRKSSYHNHQITEKHLNSDLDSEIISISKHESLNLVDPPSHSQETDIYKQSNMRAGVRGQIAEGEVRRVLLEGLHRFLTLSPRVISSLWVNYDCDLQLGNVYNFFMTFITMKSVPWPGTRHEIESEAYMDILLYYLHNMSIRNGVELPTSGWSDLIINSEYFEVKSNKSYPNESSDNNIDIADPLPPIETLLERRKTKDMMMHAANLFNQKPALGVSYLQKVKFLPTDNSTEMIVKLAQFMRSTPALNKKLVGEYISKPSSSEVLQAYLELFDFKNKRLDEATRMLLGTFRLPGESQQISRIMQAFSSVYFSSNPPDIATKDSAFVLSFAIIMLNTDLHNPQVKNRMKFEDFSKNLRGENDGQDFSSTFLLEIYQAIKSREIVFPEEHEGEAGFEYAWKEMLSKENGMVTNINSSLTDYQDQIINDHKNESSNSSHTSAKSSNVPWLMLKEYDVYDRALFLSVWPRILQSFTLTIVHCSNDHVFRLALSGLYSLLGIASKFNLADCIDETTHYLAQISGLFDPGFISDINKPIMVECSNSSSIDFSLENNSYDDNHKSNILHSTSTKDLILSNLSQMSTLSKEIQLPQHTPEPMQKLYESNTYIHWENVEKTRIPLCNLGIKLGKDYCAQIALVCSFLIAHEWPSSLGSNGWKIISKIIRALVNADLVSSSTKRTRNLISGLSTIPRADTLNRYINARNKSLKDSLGNPSFKPHDKNQSGGGLFSAISSFLGGTPTYNNSGFSTDYDQDDSFKHTDDWYLSFEKHTVSVPVGSNLESAQPYKTKNFGEAYIELFDQLSSKKTNPSTSSNYSQVISQLKPFRVRGVSRWDESTEMLIQLIFSSRKCIEACRISEIISKLSEAPEKTLTLFLTSISSTYLDGIFPLNEKSLESISDTDFSRDGLTNSLGPLSDAQKMNSISSDSPTLSSFSPGASHNKSRMNPNTTISDPSTLTTIEKSSDSGAQYDNGRKKYEPSTLYFIELIGSICEMTPHRIPVVWNVFERPFRKTLEYADSLDLFIIERLSGVLMRIIVSCLLHLETIKSKIVENSESDVSSPSLQMVDAVERVFRCIGLLRDCNKSTFDSTEETLGVGLRLIAAIDISALLSVNNWPIVSSLLSSLSKIKENSPEYPSRPGRSAFEVVMKLIDSLRNPGPSNTAFCAQSNLTYFDLIDYCTKFMPPEKLLASVSGGNSISDGSSDISMQFAIKTARQQNAYKMANIILNEISELQMHTRRELFIYAFKQETLPNDVFNTPVLSSSTANSPGAQLLSRWLRTLNTFTFYCSSRYREIRNTACKHLQKSLDRSALINLQSSVIEGDQNNKDSKKNKGASNISLPPYWINSILQRVLLPLMDGLLRYDFLTDFSMEETHIKCLSILVNFFLQYSSDLINYNDSVNAYTPHTSHENEFNLPQQIPASTLSSFNVIWMRILNVLLGYMKISKTVQHKVSGPLNNERNIITPDQDSNLDSPNLNNYKHPSTLSLFLVEISQEQLKNLILVLDSLNAFAGNSSTPSPAEDTRNRIANDMKSTSKLANQDNNLTNSEQLEVDENKNELWNQTWALIDEVNPSLKKNWFTEIDSPSINGNEAQPAEVSSINQTDKISSEITYTNNATEPTGESIAKSKSDVYSNTKNESETEDIPTHNLQQLNISSLESEDT